MNASPLLRGRGYLVKDRRPAGRPATIAPLKHKIDVSTLGRLAGATLGMNEIGVCNVHLDRDVAFDPYEVNHDTGGFIVIDRLSNETVGAGMLHFALRRAQNVHWQAIGREQDRAGGAQGAAGLRALVHGPVGRRQVDHRQPGRQEAAQHAAAHLPARRRQRPPRAQQGPRVHRRRSGREHPPHRRGRQADGRRRA